jgi:hypothetical protein
VVVGNVSFANNAGGTAFLVQSLPALNVSGSVEIAPGAQAARQLLSIGSGGLSGAGLIDLSDNDLLLQGGGSVGLSQINRLVQQGYAGGSWQGSGGITSSAAAANTTHLTALGVILNDNGSGTPLYSTFDSNPTSDGDVLVKYTYYGDTNLDGVVDGSDYSRIDNAYLNNQNSSNPQLTGWYNGDFNYDGVIDGSDYTLIDNAFNTQGASLAAQVATPTAQIAGGSSAVPEPAISGLFGIGVVGLLGRRGNRRGGPDSGADEAVRW